ERGMAPPPPEAAGGDWTVLDVHHVLHTAPTAAEAALDSPVAAWQPEALVTLVCRVFAVMYATPESQQVVHPRTVVRAYSTTHPRHTLGHMVQEWVTQRQGIVRLPLEAEDPPPSVPRSLWTLLCQHVEEHVWVMEQRRHQEDAAAAEK